MVRDSDPRSESAAVLRIGLPRTAEAPSAARAAIAGFLDGPAVEPGTLASLRLLVSELVSNAVVHSDASPASEIVLCARRLADAVRVEVTDRGRGFIPRPRDADRHGGYGLFLVENEAERWGVERADGTCVWFEMPLRPCPQAT